MSDDIRDEAAALSLSEAAYKAAGLTRALRSTVSGLFALYDAHERLNEVQPGGCAGRDGVPGVYPMSLDDWALELGSVAEDWESVAASVVEEEFEARDNVAAYHGARCPKCRRDDMIDVQASVAVRLLPEGSSPDDAASGDHEFNDMARTRCIACEHEGLFYGFRVENQRKQAAPLDAAAAAGFANGPYSAELAEAFRGGARDLQIDALDIAPGALVEPAEGGVYVSCRVYVSDAQRLLLPHEERGPRVDKPELPAALVALGFDAEVGGGGAVFASRYFESGWYIWATATGGGQSMPLETDFDICAYPPDFDGGDIPLSINHEPGEPCPEFTLERAARAAVAFCS